MNILLIIVILMTVINIVLGYKKGMVHQLVTLVSTIIGGIVVLLISAVFRNYVSGDFLNVLLVLVMLAALAIIQVAIKAVFFSLKIISKFPILHGADRIIGIVFGVVETVVLTWIVYTIIMMYDIGLLGELIRSYTAESRILSWLYQNNYIAFAFEKFLPEQVAELLNIGQKKS